MDHSWREGDVAIEAEHIAVSFGDVDDEQIAVARIAPTSPPGSFLVQFVVDPNAPLDPTIIEQVRTELDFYLVEKGEHDPWAYAIYHCSSAGNLYGDIHWAYFPK